MAINKPVDIAPESNTYFASLLSQKEKWKVNEIVYLCLFLLEPFNGLNISKLDYAPQLRAKLHEVEQSLLEHGLAYENSL